MAGRCERRAAVSEYLAGGVACVMCGPTTGCKVTDE